MICRDRKIELSLSTELFEYVTEIYTVPWRLKYIEYYDIVNKNNEHFLFFTSLLKN